MHYYYCFCNVLHNLEHLCAFPARLRTDSACTLRLWLTSLHASFSVARQFSQLRVFFSTVHGLSCCFLHIFVGSSHACICGGFSTWLVSSLSQNYLLRPRTGKVTTSKYLRVTISTVSCLWAPCSQSASRWVSVAWSASIRSQKGAWVLLQGGSGLELPDSRSDETLGIPWIDVTLGSDGGGSTPSDSDVPEGPSFDPEDW